MKILLANPRGFCAGVDRAISIVELALEIHGAPIYVRHEVVHNRFVVDGLKRNTLRFKARVRMIFVMRPPIANKRCVNWQNSRSWYW